MSLPVQLAQGKLALLLLPQPQPSPQHWRLGGLEGAGSHRGGQQWPGAAHSQGRASSPGMWPTPDGQWVPGAGGLSSRGWLRVDICHARGQLARQPAMVGAGTTALSPLPPAKPRWGSLHNLERPPSHRGASAAVTALSPPHTPYPRTTAGMMVPCCRQRRPCGHAPQQPPGKGLMLQAVGTGTGR